MKKKYLESVDEWYLENDYKDLVLSNDIDSLISCAILNQVHPNWKINYYYDFNYLYRDELSLLFKEDYERVWVDVAIQNGEKAFDNHLSTATLFDIPNPNMINPNNIVLITNDEYCKRYAGSTALLLWSLFDIPLPESEEGKMLLLAVDTAFKGFYNERFFFEQFHFMYDMFGFDELLTTIQRHSKEEFYDIIKKYKLSSSRYPFVIDGNGRLQIPVNTEQIGKLLGIKIEKPENVFEKIQEFNKTKHIDILKHDYKVADRIGSAFSYAFTYKNRLTYTKEKI